MQNQNTKSPGITTTEAIELAKKKGFTFTRPTLIKWLDELGIGKKVGGRYYIDREKFLWWLKYGNS